MDLEAWVSGQLSSDAILQSPPNVPASRIFHFALELHHCQRNPPISRGIGPGGRQPPRRIARNLAGGRRGEPRQLSDGVWLCRRHCGRGHEYLESSN
jgi:hypothetical protein